MTFLLLTKKARDLLLAIEPAERRQRVTTAAFKRALGRGATEIQSEDIEAATEQEPA